MTFGMVPGVALGAAYPNRTELARSGVHRPPMAGIAGTKQDGAESIVVSGGYVDDEDYGDVIIYTGQGGRPTGSTKQEFDQELTRGNLALAVSASSGRPVRVIRGANGDPQYSPPQGFRFDGLYRVDAFWHEIGRDGYRVYRYRMERIADTEEYEPQGGEALKLDEGGVPPEGSFEGRRKAGVIQRIIRNTKVSDWVKATHSYKCQVCGVRLETQSGPYAEGAHIRPLGRPHNGPDSSANVLCLCPNHHVLLDKGAIYISDDLVVRAAEDGARIEELTIADRHVIDVDHLRYHRATIAAIP